MNDRPWLNYIMKIGNLIVTFRAGKKHSLEGAPAMKTPDMQVWYDRGKLHRENGPAKMIKSNLYVEHWINNVPYGKGIITQETFDHYWFKDK